MLPKSGHKLFKTLCAVLLLMALLTPALVQAHKVQVFGGTGCVDAPSLETQLLDVIQELAPDRRDTQDLIARVALSLSNYNLSVSLKLMDNSGKTALSRRYQLHRQDCPDVSSLLQLVLEEFLREFPENPWREAQLENDNLKIKEPQNQTGLAVGLALLTTAEPWTPTLEASLHLEGNQLRPFDWLAGLHLRAALPQNALNGRYQRFDLLLSGGASTSAWQTQWELEFLVGLMILQGDSFQENRTALAPNIEIKLGTRWHWKQFSLGPRLGIQLLKHNIEVLPSNARAHISIVNLGLSLQYDMI